jgi:scyllo-inositol 2-dehydrogenase (NADP+)
MKDIFNVAIIGFGVSGRYFFAPFFSAHQHFILKAFVSSQTDEVKKNYPETEVFLSVDELLVNDEIDLVVIASPNPTHFDYAMRALMAGKNVIVEKPFTITSDEAGELIVLSQKQNKLLAPFQNRRWDGDFLTVKKIVGEGLLGEVLEFESHFDRFRPGPERAPWKDEPVSGVGAIYDLGPHLIDQALVLFGKPDGIFANIQRLRKNGLINDTFEIQLYYPLLKVILKAGVMVREVGPRFAVHGRNGSFVKYGLDPQESNLKNGIMPGKPLLGKDAEENFGLLHAEINQIVVREKVETIQGNYMGFFDNIYEALSGKAELIVKPTDAKMTMEVIEMAIQSNNHKRVMPF